jgi:hypothetical protein
MFGISKDRHIIIKKPYPTDRAFFFEGMLQSELFT